MHRVRNSQLRQLQACPFAYAETYVHGREGLPSPSLNAGRNAHAVIADMVRSFMRDGVADVHAIAFRAVQGGVAEYDDALQIAIRVQEAIGVDVEIDFDQLLALEETMAMPLVLRDGTTVEFFGTPDLVERTGKRTVTIIDYKTHWRPETESEFKADQQLKRYALLVSHAYPRFERFRLVKWFVRYRNSTYEETITAEELVQVRERLISEIEVEREVLACGEFPATPGSWCSLCTHHGTCPVIRRYREEGIDDLSIPDDRRAAALAGDVIALSAAADAIHDTLRRYLGDEHVSGQVPVSGGVYGYAPVEQREADIGRIRTLLMDHGVDVPADLWKIDLAVFDRMLKRLPEDTVQALEQAITHRQSSRLGFHKHSQVAAPAKAGAAVTEDLFG